MRLRLMSDVPLGAMLSGGIDSSVIVALMARQMTEPVKTFSVGFAEAGDGNELADARLVAEHFGTDHHELELSFAERDRRPRASSSGTWTSRSPISRRSASSRSRSSRRQHVTVALSGQGADELLGGYRKHRAAAIAAAVEAPAAHRSGAAGLAAMRLGPSRLERAARTLARPDPAERLLAMSGNLGPTAPARARARPARRARRVDARSRILRERLGDASPDDPLPAALYLDAQLGLVDDMLHYFDRASMAHSLEVRVPFLDHHVVELCATIPARHKVRRLDTKHVLKHAARGLVPDRIIDKPKVGFFNAAVDGWFRAPDAAARSPTICSGRARGTPSCSTGRASRRSSRDHVTGADTSNCLHAALGADAGGLAVVLPSARDRRPDAAPARTHHRRMMRYAVVTPARNEAANLPRLAARSRAQTVLPEPGSSSTTVPPTGRSTSRRRLPAVEAGFASCRCRERTSAERGAPGRACARGGNRRARQRSARRRRQGRRRHLVRARTTSSGCSRVRR